jgi:uncharacterized protein (DUF302 family)
MNNQSIRQQPALVPFSGTRVRFDSELDFEAVLENLRAHVGRPSALELSQIKTDPSTHDEFARKIEGYIGDSEFMLFLELDHGAWIAKFGIRRRVLRWILGNPLIAITMIRHDVSAGLFAPVELLLVENERGGASVTYVLPSSLMMIEGNAELRNAAIALDTKLEKLVAGAVK